MTKDLIICRCEEITLSEIEKAIEEGYTTVAAIRRKTRAGMGLCQGRSCGRLVEEILGKDAKPARSRPPVRLVKLNGR